MNISSYIYDEGKKAAYIEKEYLQYYNERFTPWIWYGCAITVDIFLIVLLAKWYFSDSYDVTENSIIGLAVVLLIIITVAILKNFTKTKEKHKEIERINNEAKIQAKKKAELKFCELFDKFKGTYNHTVNQIKSFEKCIAENKYQEYLQRHNSISQNINSVYQDSYTFFRV